MFPYTYRAGLFYYSTILVVFLCFTLIYSYYYTRNIIFQEVENSLLRNVHLLESQLEAERKELQRYAGIVSDNLRIQEYMFIVVRVGSASEPLRQLYDRLYSWLPIDRMVLIADNGEVLMGNEYAGLVRWVNTQKDKLSNKIHYRASDHGPELVAIAPVFYRNDQLGVVAVTKVMNTEWLQQLRRSSGGHLIIEQDGQIQQSTHSDLSTQKIVPQDRRLSIGDQVYRLYPINLPFISEHPLHFWFCVSETELIDTLDQHSRFTMLLVVAGILAILLVGIMIFRNFNRPLSALMALTQQIAEGQLPETKKKIQAQNEIDVLANKFADMVGALRKSKAEVDQAHKQLAQIAITDSLTDLYNRRHLLEIFPKLHSQAHRDWRCLTAILCDLDYFKQINDKYGHLAGDQCLVHFAGLLRQYSRANDFLFRIGGEEFLMISIGKDVSGSITVAEKVRNATAGNIVKYNNLRISLTVSCGVSYINPDEDQETALSHLLSRTDAALYEAKDKGRNTVCVSQGWGIVEMKKLQNMT